MGDKMKEQSIIDTNCMTITRFFLAEQRRIQGATGDFTQLLTSIQSACKAISSAVRRAGLTNLFGVAGSTNVQGESVKKLDVLANELFINMLSSSYTCSLLVSEENETVIEIPDEKRGKYIVAFDPLDGSSNIDCLVSIGSIFCIFHVPEEKLESQKSALQSGRKIIASGYALYGSATMLVISLNNQVNGFMLDPTIGEFVLTDSNLKIPQKGKIYSVNEGYKNQWTEPGVEKYILKKKNEVKPYGARYVGSMVADVHRTIKYGGIFMYPATKDSPKGKLRVLYECFPMAHIIETAGGIASNGRQNILDIVPKGLHERAPVFMGSADDVLEVLSCIEAHKL